MSGPNLTPTSYVVLGPTSGRRRRRYRLTTAGRAALDEWLTIPADDIGELRDPGLLKLSFSGRSDPRAIVELALGQEKVHEERITMFESVRDRFGAHADADQMATLELGLRWHRVAPDFWAETAASPP